ncbi:MAG: HemK family protein methyltransferase, partial [Wenzhouxiangella sp.]
VSAVLDLPPDFEPISLARIPTPDQRSRLDALLDARIRDRRPLAYLLGEAWFAGMRFQVNESTLIPRSPLAEIILGGMLPWLELDRPLRVLDVGTGSGCIAIALAAHWPQLQIDATDISENALTVARANGERHGVTDRVRFVQSDVYQALPGERYDLIISNPPYVPAASMQALPDEYR